MKEIKLDMLKEYQRPIVKIDNIDAIIDTGALIPVFSLPSHIVELAYNPKLILNNTSISGIGGACEGKVYEMNEFKIGDLKFIPFQFFVPDEPISKHPFLIPASMFYGTDYEFDTINNQFIIRVEKEEDLTRSFKLKDLKGSLYAQIDEILLQDDDEYSYDQNEFDMSEEYEEILEPPSSSWDDDLEL